MSETAARQCDRVLPPVPYRQWVLSLPWELRLPVARDPALLNAVSRVFFEEAREWLRAIAGPTPGARVEEEVMALVNSLGGCERIRKTPTPLGYVLLLRRMVALYLATLPLCLVAEIGLLTPLVTMIIAYAVLMIEGIGQELDNPFGHDPNDLALSRVCDTIERDLLGSSSLDVVLVSTARFPDED